MIAFILNLPYTVLGVLAALVLIPTRVEWNKEAMALVFRVRISRLVDFIVMKGWRGTAAGHVIILNPREKPTDLAHELVHVEQNARLPLIFPFLYRWETLRKGYRNNKYEVEAYSRTGDTYVNKMSV